MNSITPKDDTIQNDRPTVFIFSIQKKQQPRHKSTKVDAYTGEAVQLVEVGQLVGHGLGEIHQLGLLGQQVLAGLVQGVGLGGDVDVLAVQLLQVLQSLVHLHQHAVALLPVAVQLLCVLPGPQRKRESIAMYPGFR